MPRNLYGGNKAKKGKNFKFKNVELILREDDNYGYGQVVKNLGNGLLDIIILNEKGYVKPALGHIRGKIRRIKFFKNDIILIGYREYEKKYNSLLNVDILYKYSEDHKNSLVSLGEIIIYQDEYSHNYQNDEVEFMNPENEYLNTNFSDDEFRNKNLLSSEENNNLDEGKIDEINNNKSDSSYDSDSELSDSYINKI